MFRYSAAGQKVAKLVYQSGKPTLRTDYLGPYQYEQDSLRFFPHAEGRVLRFVSKDAAGQPTTSYQREFTFKDHLGNLRLAYRLGHHATFSAGLEPADASRETQQFDSLSVSAPVAQAVGSLARTGSYVARLNAGGSAPQPLGALTQLSVQQGDTVTVLAPGYYPQAVSNNSFVFSLASFVAGLLQPQPTMPGVERRRGGLPLLSLGVSAGLPALGQTGGGVPKGYVRLLVFDADSNLVATQTQQLSAAAHAGYEALQVQVIAPSDGYVTAYVGNESAADVYFDDVRVSLGQNVQVQETQYDPVGLELAGLGTTTPGLKPLNQYKFNGKEFQPDLGLNWNHQDWRFFDTQLGRWHVVDPEIENGQEAWGPYSFGFDNAVRYADADGRCPGGKCPPDALKGTGNAASSPDILTEVGKSLKEGITRVFSPKGGVAFYGEKPAKGNDSSKGKRQGDGSQMENDLDPIMKTLSKPGEGLGMEKDLASMLGYVADVIAFGKDFLERVGNFTGEDPAALIKSSTFVQSNPVPRKANEKAIKKGENRIISSYLDKSQTSSGKDGKPFQTRYTKEVTPEGDTVSNKKNIPVK